MRSATPPPYPIFHRLARRLPNPALQNENLWLPRAAAATILFSTSPPRPPALQPRSRGSSMRRMLAVPAVVVLALGLLFSRVDPSPAQKGKSPVPHGQDRMPGPAL